MIYKLLYQELPDEVPVRKRISSLYLKTKSKKDVRDKLRNRNYNIKLIHPLDEDHLPFKKQSTNCQPENL